MLHPLLLLELLLQLTLLLQLQLFLLLLLLSLMLLLMLLLMMVVGLRKLRLLKFLGALELGSEKVLLLMLLLLLVLSRWRIVGRELELLLRSVERDSLSVLRW